MQQLRLSDQVFSASCRASLTEAALSGVAEEEEEVEEGWPSLGSSLIVFHTNHSSGCKRGVGEREERERESNRRGNQASSGLKLFSARKGGSF